MSELGAKSGVLSIRSTIEDPSVSLTPSQVFKVSDNMELPIVSTALQRPARVLSMNVVENVALNVDNAILFRNGAEAIDATIYMTEADRDRPPKVNLRNDRVAAELVFIAYNGGWRNYYHLLTQGIFSVWLINTFFPDPHGQFVFPDINSKMKGLMALCGAGDTNTSYFHRNKSLVVDKAAYLDLTFGRFAYYPSILLRSFADDLYKIMKPDERSSRKVYISRRDSKNRSMSNEADLESALAGEGFEIVTLSLLPVAAQAEVFRSADIIVAPHGAGLSNTVFCRPGTRVMELIPAVYTNDCFIRMSEVLGLRHEMHVFPSPPADSGRHSFNWQSDIPYILSKI